MKIIVLRNLKTRAWKFFEGEPLKFKHKSYPGYRFYRSFNTLPEAQTYATEVERNESELESKYKARNTNESLLFD